MTFKVGDIVRSTFTGRQYTVAAVKFSGYIQITPWFQYQNWFPPHWFELVEKKKEPSGFQKFMRKHSL